MWIESCPGFLGIDNLIYAFIFADEDEDSGLREAGQEI